MKRSTMFLATLLIIAAVGLAACGPQGTPTPSLSELQATAMANAQAQLALTAAAMPTATQIPTQIPTAIPTQPTLQPMLALPTVAPTAAAVIIPTATKTSGGNPCNVTLNGVTGPHVDVTFQAVFKSGLLSFYYYMYKTAFGCGFGNVTLNPGDVVTVSIPKACYDFYGWLNGPQPHTPAGYACFAKASTVKVTADGINVSSNP